MPIPTPREGERKQEFMNRCMSDEVMVNEYKVDQRFAICSSQWKNRNKKSQNKNEK